MGRNAFACLSAILMLATVSGCSPSRPKPVAQPGLGISLTPTGLSLTGAAADVSEDISQSNCSNAIATFGQKRVRPTSVVRGMTSCDLYFLKGQPNSIRTGGFRFGTDDGGVAKNMVLTYTEDGVERRYHFIDNLLDEVE